MQMISACIYTQSESLKNDLKFKLTFQVKPEA